MRPRLSRGHWPGSLVVGEPLSRCGPVGVARRLGVAQAVVGVVVVVSGDHAGARVPEPRLDIEDAVLVGCEHPVPDADREFDPAASLRSARVATVLLRRGVALDPTVDGEGPLDRVSGRNAVRGRRSDRGWRGRRLRTPGPPGPAAPLPSTPPTVQADAGDGIQSTPAATAMLNRIVSRRLMSFSFRRGPPDVTRLPGRRTRRESRSTPRDRRLALGQASVTHIRGPRAMAGRRRRLLPARVRPAVAVALRCPRSRCCRCCRARSWSRGHGC